MTLEMTDAPRGGLDSSSSFKATTTISPDLAVSVQPKEGPSTEGKGTPDLSSMLPSDQMVYGGGWVSSCWVCGIAGHQHSCAGIACHTAAAGKPYSCAQPLLAHLQDAPIMVRNRLLPLKGFLLPVWSSLQYTPKTQPPPPRV